MAIAESLRSYVESNIFIDTDPATGLSTYIDYISDTSIFYEDIEKQLPKNEFLITNLVFDDEMLYDIKNEVGAVVSTWALFTFYVSDFESYSSSGRVVWIDVTAPAATIRINKLAPNVHLATFDYPGAGYNFYIRPTGGDWQLTTPVTSNALYIESSLTDIHEIAIARDILKKTSIVLRRKL